MKYTLFFIGCMVLVSCATKKSKVAVATLPQVVSNYDSIDFVGHSNANLLKFAKHQDFVLAQSYVGYWGGYEKYYDVIALKNGKWNAYHYPGRKEYGTKILFFMLWRRDSIMNGRFNPVKKDIPQYAMDSLFAKIHETRFLELEQDAINLKTGEVTKHIADGSVPTIDILKNGKKLSLTAFNNCVCDTDYRRRFDAFNRYFSLWWSRYCKSE
jgi:hypothetical protein